MSKHFLSASSWFFAFNRSLSSSSCASGSGRYSPSSLPSWQNPVHYTTLEDLGIDPSTLKFEKIQKVEKQAETEIQPLSIEQAKEGLSKKFGIAPEQIEIVIKG
ncbi:MAG: hypothetical protein WA919_26085 [Coleofasciculaceae cyanobacterium]